MLMHPSADSRVKPEIIFIRSLKSDIENRIVGAANGRPISSFGIKGEKKLREIQKFLPVEGHLR
jgi:hypothetical protein